MNAETRAERLARAWAEIRKETSPPEPYENDESWRGGEHLIDWPEHNASPLWKMWNDLKNRQDGTL